MNTAVNVLSTEIDKESVDYLSRESLAFFFLLHIFHYYIGSHF